MAEDLLPALDPLLDPRSPAAQAVLDRTSYSVRGLGNPAGAFLAPDASPARGFRATTVPVQGSACAAGVLGSSRGSAPSPLPPRRHSQGCTTSTDPASLAFRRALA